jgi:ribosomal protein L21E
MSKASELLEKLEINETRPYGSRVRIDQKGRGYKEFHGKVGTVIGHEMDGRTTMHRVKLDEPVEIPGVGKVKDDLWAPEYLKSHKDK